MAKLSELRKKAKGMGISAAVIRRATTAAELQSVISDHDSHDGKPTKKSATKKAVKKAVAKKKAPAKKSARKASTPAKSKGAKAKRSSNSNGYEAKGGRNTLSKVNFKKTDGWNAREGSAPDRIIKALARFKGDRSKVFDHLKSDVWDFVQKKKANGEKRTKAEALDMLKYRISRTAWDFAMRTGQHEASENRVKYGTGGTGTGAFKPAGSRKSSGGRQKASKSSARKAAAKPGRKPAKAQRGAQRGRKAAGRGRAKAGRR